MRLDRTWIEAHIPHHGTMCLLDAVHAWDAERIDCRSATHRDPSHPMRAHGRLGAACGVEYAAQAMAVHGALLAGAATPGAQHAVSVAVRPAAGFLASLRGLTLYVHRLDDVPGDLTCRAVRAAGDTGSALYDFEILSVSTPLISGRATVMLDARGRFNP